MDNETEEVWVNPDPIKVIALEQAVIFCSSLHKNDPDEVNVAAKVFENYLRSPS